MNIRSYILALMFSAFALTALMFCDAMAMGPSVDSREIAAHKPASPVKVSIGLSDPDAISRSGDMIDLVITIRSGVASDKMTIKIILTGGVELISGKPKVIIPIERNETVKQTITVRLPEHKSWGVRVRASLKQRGGAMYSHSTAFDGDKPVSTTTSTDKGTTTRDAKGREILEFRAD